MHPTSRCRAPHRQVLPLFACAAMVELGCSVQSEQLTGSAKTKT